MPTDANSTLNVVTKVRAALAELCAHTGRTGTAGRIVRHASLLHSAIARHADLSPVEGEEGADETARADVAILHLALTQYAHAARVVWLIAESEAPSLRLQLSRSISEDDGGGADDGLLAKTAVRARMLDIEKMHATRLMAAVERLGSGGEPDMLLDELRRHASQRVVELRG